MSSPPPVPLSAFWHDLPRPGKWLLSTVIVDFVGNGLVLPFSVVYLHEVRGFPLGQVGLLLAIPAVVGLLVVGPAGIVIDRIGARGVVIASLLGQVAAQVVLATAGTPVRAAVAMVLLGLSGGVVWPAINALVAVVVPSGQRQRYFGVNFTLLNLGIGVGGVLGGLFVDVHRPGSFVAIYLLDAATYLAPLAILLGPLRHVSGRVPRPSRPLDAEPAGGTTYLALLRDRSVAPVLLLTFVASFVGYGQLSTGIPAFGRAQAQISTQVLGWAFAANTLVIVVLQLLVLQRIEGRRRTRLLVLMSGIWVVAFLALGASGLASGSLLGALLFGACLSVFGLGETLYQPTAPAMVNDLAPDHLRGRYNALMSIAWQLASVVGPPVAGLLIGRGWATAYIGLLVGGCALVAVLALAVERRVPPHVNGVRPPPLVPAGGADERPAGSGYA
ncbi:MFS transporter [Dermatophilaceae bacterium Soc4.6]